MIIESIKNTISKLEFLCNSYETPEQVKLKDVEETVLHLSHEVQLLDLAGDQLLKKELSTLEHTLARLSELLKKQQENIERHVQEINLQQRALSAYARVANNNLGTMIPYQ